MRRIKISACVALLVLGVVVTSVSNRNPALAGLTIYGCHDLDNSCTGYATCQGDRWMKTGTCSISCLNESGRPGEFVVVSSASCTGGGRAPGSTPGSN